MIPSGPFLFLATKIRPLLACLSFGVLANEKMNSATKHLLNASEIDSIVITSAFKPPRWIVTGKQANKGRVFIAKNRNGPDVLIFPAFVDWSNVNMQVLKSEKEESIADVIKDKEINTLEYMRNKYSKIKK